MHTALSAAPLYRTQYQVVVGKWMSLCFREDSASTFHPTAIAAFIAETKRVFGQRRKEKQAKSK